MKILRVFFFVISVFLSIFSFSQEKKDVNLYLRLQDSEKLPLTFFEITLTEKESQKKMLGTTDHRGKLDLVVEKGKIYSFSCKDSANFWEISIPENSFSFMNRTITFDSKNTVFHHSAPDTVKQNFEKKPEATANEQIVRLKIMNLTSQKSIPNIEVRMYNKNLHKIFVTQTDQEGAAKFLLPVGKYFLGIEKLSNYQVFTVEKQDLPLTKLFAFVPTTNVQETLKQDTITQVFPNAAEATSSRVLVKITMRDYSQQLLANEDVYLDALEAKKVYFAKTNQSGVAIFLLPKGDRYTLNFRYERDIFLWDYPSTQGLHSSRFEATYRGTEMIETYHSERKRDKDGFFLDFYSPKIQTEMLPENVVEKTDNGFNLNFPNQCPSSSSASPTFVDGKIFCGAGYFSSKFYCLNAKTGEYIWGISFAEGGPTSAVYSDGVILVSTESCTLYALEAQTGNLLWSKHLATYVFSTPSVVDGKVFAAYPFEHYANGREVFEKENNYALVVFELKTGKIVWQQRLDNEILGSPVICDNNVYLTTFSGTMYRFEAKTGKLLSTFSNKLNNEAVVTSPTIVDNSVFVSIRSSKNKRLQEVAMFSRDLKLQKKFSHLQDSMPFRNKKFDECRCDKFMNHTGTRILHYKGKNYNVVAGKLFCTKPEDGSIIWSKAISNSAKFRDDLVSMPVVVNNKIVVANPNGKIQIFDAASGNLVNQYLTYATLFTPPVIYDGWIYCGTEEGRIIAINTRNSQFSGWQQFGKDAMHNPVVK